MGCIQSKPELIVPQVSIIPTKWTHLAFSGGGANGIMYAGAYRAAWESGIINANQGAVGTSIGSLFATLAVLRVHPKEMHKRIMELDTDKLMDNSWFPIDDIVQFIKYLGIYRGRYLEAWCESVISSHIGIENCTFEQMYKKTQSHLKICVCNETLGHVEYWDHQNQPNMPVALAIRTSASIPFMYDPVRHGNDLYIDGGVCDIFPLNGFGNKTTLGFLILNQNEQKSTQLVTTLIEHANAVYECMSAIQFSLQHTGDWANRTIALRGPQKSKWDMKFTKYEKEQWIEQSYKSTIQDLNPEQI